MTFPHSSDVETPLAALTVGAATAHKQTDGSWQVFAASGPSNGQQIGTIQPANGGWLATTDNQSASFDNIKKAVQFIAG